METTIKIIKEKYKNIKVIKLTDNQFAYLGKLVWGGGGRGAQASGI